MESIIGFLIVLLLWVKFSRIIAKNKNRSKTWWRLERIRSCIAYEGDPGPYQEKNHA